MVFQVVMYKCKGWTIKQTQYFKENFKCISISLTKWNRNEKQMTEENLEIYSHH